MEKGKFMGEPYDGIMTDIYVDHVALVEQGRAGHDVRVADKRLKRQMSQLNKLGQNLVVVLIDFISQTNVKKWIYL